MKIAMVAPVPPPYGGIGNWVLMLDRYVEEREDIEFVHINTAPKQRGLDGRTLWDRVVGQTFSMFSQKKQLKKAIKEEQVDVIHMTTSGQLAIIRDIFLLKTAKRKKVPTVYHIRFGRIPEIALKNTLEWKLIKKAMLLADCVVAIDNATRNAILKYAPKVNVSCVPNPFDLEKLENIPINREQEKKEIVFLGWVVKTKGVEELLAAWASLAPEYPDWALRLIGPYAQDYHVELKEKFPVQQVVFDGEQSHDEAMRLLSQASVFILPSYTEGFPNSVLEAMALEKPIVATTVGAIPDMLEGCGITIESKSVDSIVQALKKLLDNENLRTELGAKGKEKLINEYALDKIFKQYEKIWGEV